jgi:hypothetical protein
MCLHVGVLFPQLNPLTTVQEEEEVDDEDMGVAETYADYMPTKCEYALHLLPLSTSLLSFVLLITN